MTLRSVAAAALSLISAGTSASAEKIAPPSTKFLICAAYSDTVATALRARGLNDAATEMMSSADKFAAFALALDVLEHFPAEDSKRMLEQLTTAFKGDLTDAGILALTFKHQGRCLEVSRKAGELEEYLNRYKPPPDAIERK